mgnify:FL=1
MNSIVPYYQRHSTRLFTDQPVPREMLTEVVRTANYAPSWENSQPWKVYLAIGQTANAIRTEHFKAVQTHRKSWTEGTPPLAWQKTAQANIDHIL